MDELKLMFLIGPSACTDRDIREYSQEFLDEIGANLGTAVKFADLDEIKKNPFSLYFIGSGGAEIGFEKIYDQTKEPYILVTTPGYNSLAASMEIMGFLNDKGLKGEILHGSAKAIAERLEVIRRTEVAKEKLKQTRLGVFEISEHLIASHADFDRVKCDFGIEMVDLDLDEIVDEYKKGGYPENQYTEELKQKNYNCEEIEKAMNVYGALKRLIDRYDLSGVTVKCFDLLNRIDTTGCLALAILNAEKIPAACEGDHKSLISMAVLNALTGEPGFMANPSCMYPETGEIIFAHCTLPLDMPDTYELTTHFESGIGVAVASELAPQIMTVFKCDDKAEHFYVDKAQLLETMHKSDLCRTQMRLRLEKGTEYFSTGPISNHHIICKGDWAAVINEFFRNLK